MDDDFVTITFYTAPGTFRGFVTDGTAVLRPWLLVQAYLSPAGLVRHVENNVGKQRTFTIGRCSSTSKRTDLPEISATLVCRSQEARRAGEEG